MRENRFGFFFCLGFFVCYCCSCCSSEEDGKNRQTFVIRYRDGEQTIPVTVVLDYKKQTEYVINMNPRSPAKSVTLYDFKQRTIAYKDLSNRECFLGRLTYETLREESNALQDVKNPVEVRPKMRSLDPKMPALTPTEIRNIAGQKTAVFCRKMNTWLLVPEKSHSIGKRETDKEFEDSTFQHHGHRSTHYSHHERETRRRFRKRNQQNHRRRSRIRESAAKNGNDDLEVSESNTAPSDIVRNFIPEKFNSISDASSDSLSNNYRTAQSPELVIKKQADKREISSANVLEFENSNDDFKPSSLANSYSSSYDSNTNSNWGIPSLNYDTVRDSSKNFARLASDDYDEETEEKMTTTSSPSVLQQQNVEYSNVHSSLAHLLPLYKPLGQEFEFDEGAEDETKPPSNQHRNIETEANPLNASLAFVFSPDTYKSPVDPDVSVDILEVPKVTKEFENIRNKNSSGSTTEDERILASSSQRNLAKTADEVYFKENLPQAEVPSTLEPPVWTTRDYYAPARTTPATSYVPSVHTAFQNLEDFNSFQIFTNYVENNVVPSENLSVHTFYDLKQNKDASVDEVPQHVVITTEYPLTLSGKHKDNSDYRPDIPREDLESESALSKHDEHQTEKESYPLNVNNRSDGIFSPHQIRYQNALRNFKPDEIIIDIGNIPTHTPPAPVTASFHRRVLTTIQPAIASQSDPASGRSDASRIREQSPGTTWRSLVPSTRHPRRKLNPKLRKPVQTISVIPSHSVSSNHKFAPFRANQLFEVSHFNVEHPNNRHQFHYANSPPIPPSRMRMRAEINQIHHINNLNNLPPGVSMHPRHPQAPFADMVHSNRPPTMPFIIDNQEHPKPHRQRHHRKKDRLLNSCCRLRGKPGALQSCCRNGGPCCSSSHRGVQPTGGSCCSSSKINGLVVPANQIQVPVRTANKILQPVRTEKTYTSEKGSPDRCQKEKMCRTLYESTRQVMVCRNAQIEGC